MSGFILFILGIKTGIWRICFLKKGDILKSASYTCQHPTYGFLVPTPVQLGFGKERVLLETKMPLNSDTVIASVGTCGGGGRGTNCYWFHLEECPSSEVIRSYTQPHSSPHDEAQWCYKNYKLQRGTAVSRETFRGATDRNRCVETFHRLKMITEE